MKKKGLIVATIVMVLVLAVSITTATYAWFTTDAQAKVNTISVGVTTQAKVMIGVSTTNEIVPGTALESNFMYDSLTFSATPDTDGNKWSDGQPGLGTSINTGLTMNAINMACYSATLPTGADANDATKYQIDAKNTFNPTHQFIKVTGNGDNKDSADKQVFAYANNHNVSSETQPGDYLDVTFGVRAAQSNITSISLVLGIDNANTVNLGMATAFNYWYETADNHGDEAEGIVTDIYTQPYTTTIDNATLPLNPKTNAAWNTTTDGISWVPGKGDGVVVIELAKAAEGQVLTTTDIYQIHLIVFLNGWDSDCNNSSASAGIKEGSSIKIDFITTEKAAA